MTEADVISIDEVKRIANLARLGLGTAEAKQAAQDLQDILGHFAAIQGISVEDVPLSDDVTGLNNVVREDTPDQLCLTKPEELLALTPAVAKNQVKVTAVFT